MVLTDNCKFSSGKGANVVAQLSGIAEMCNSYPSCLVLWELRGHAVNHFASLASRQRSLTTRGGTPRNGMISQEIVSGESCHGYSISSIDAVWAKIGGESSRQADSIVACPYTDSIPTANVYRFST